MCSYVFIAVRVDAIEQRKYVSYSVNRRGEKMDPIKNLQGLVSWIFMSMCVFALCLA